MTTQLSKTSAGVLDYGVDWSAWLATGDSIASSSWTADAGIIVTDAGTDGSVTSALVSGGAENQTYTLTNRITTANGLTDERSIRLRIVPRRYA